MAGPSQSIDCVAAAELLGSAIGRNVHCIGPVITGCRAFAVACGPSGGPEALAFIHADDPFADGFWYGHAMRHPNRKGGFVALLAWSSKFLNAITVPLLFRRHHHWMMVDPHYQPCRTKVDGDAYAETPSFDTAVTALVRMIDRFDPGLRSGYEDSAGADDPVEMRILEVYGLAGSLMEDGPPPVPMPPALVVAARRP